MKKKAIENKVFIIIILFLFSCSLGYVYKQQIDKHKTEQRVIEMLLNSKNETEKEFVKENLVYKDGHWKFKDSGEYYTGYEYYFDIMSDLRFLIFLAAPFVTLSGSYNLFKKLKSGLYKDIIIRSKYNQFLKKEIIKSWLSASIYPIFIIFTLIISFTIYPNHDLSKATSELPRILDFYISKPDFFMIIYILNIFLLCLSYVNVSLIVIRYTKNFIISTLVSVIIIYFIDILIFIFIGPLLHELFNNFVFRNVVFFHNFFVYDGLNNVEYSFIYALVLFIISTGSVWLFYRNKEKVIISNEK